MRGWIKRVGNDHRSARLVAEQRWDSGRHGGGVYLHLPSPAEVLNVVFADVVIEK